MFLKGYIIRFHKTVFFVQKKKFARSDLTFLILGVERSDFVRFLEIIFLKFESKIEMLTWVLSKSQNKNLKIDFSKCDILISRIFFIFMINREKRIPHVFSCQSHILTHQMGTPKPGRF